MKSTLARIATLSGLILGAFAVSAVAATWTPPPSAPPTGNPDAPVNVGSVTQTKLGWLGVRGLIATDFTLATSTPAAGKVLTAIDSLGNAAWQTPASIPGGPVIKSGTASLVCANYSTPGSVAVTFPSAFATAPQVTITPNWTNYSGDEAPSWWITNVTTSGFTIHVHTSGSGTCYGNTGAAAGIYWIAVGN